jgi:hypothetical protein
MPILHPATLPLLVEFAPCFTQPTYHRFATLLAAAILTTGRRTVANLLRTLGPLASGHRTDYQRVLCRAPWSGLRLGCALAGLILTHLAPDGPVILVGDDTVDGHPGKHVYGKARHRDPVRSSHADTTWRWGHRGVVLAILVRLPGANRPWALPVLVDLDRSEEEDRRRRRPHRTPARLMCRLLRLALSRFPGRRFVVVGDSGSGPHEVARSCHRHRDRLTLVSKMHPEANRFDPPPPYRGIGRPRIKGERRPRPREGVAAASHRTALTVGWYGGGTRLVEVVTGTGPWSKAGHGLVPIRWVFVHDLEGSHRDEDFYATDPEMDPAAIVTHYAGRWKIEGTFQGLRSHLGLETTRGWCRKTVERAAPCLFGLYSVVALLDQAPPGSRRTTAVRWPGKAGVTSSDALSAVRLWLWDAWVFPRVGGGVTLEKLPEPLRELLMATLAPAA